MDDQTIAALARAAGLDKALAQFPDDVRVAAASAVGNADALRIPADPAAEPWPAMDVSVGRAGVSI